jgi:Holliday junction resolvasome RuvABC endonuclease subunit
MDGVFDPAASFTISTGSKEGTDIERADRIAKRIIKHLDSLMALEPTVFIEDYAYARLTNREKMGELGGVVKHTLLQHFIKWETLPISTIRKIVVGKGNAKKELVMYALLKRHNLDITQNDIADAAAVALTGEFIWKGRERQAEMDSWLVDVRDAVKNYLKTNP